MLLNVVWIINTGLIYLELILIIIHTLDTNDPITMEEIQNTMLDKKK